MDHRWGDDSSSEGDNDDAEQDVVLSTTRMSPAVGRSDHAGPPPTAHQQNSWTNRGGGSGSGRGGNRDTAGGRGRGGGDRGYGHGNDHFHSSSQSAYLSHIPGGKGDRDRGGGRGAGPRGGGGGGGRGSNYRGGGEPDWKAAAKSASILNQPQEATPDGVSWMEQRRLKQQEQERERKLQAQKQREDLEKERATKRKSQLAALKEAMQSIQESQVSSLQAALSSTSITPPHSPKQQPSKPSPQQTKILARPIPSKSPPRSKEAPSTATCFGSSLAASTSGGATARTPAHPPTHYSSKKDTHLIETASGRRVEYRIEMNPTSSSNSPLTDSKRKVELLPNGSVVLTNQSTTNETRMAASSSLPASSGSAGRGRGGRGGRGGSAGRDSDAERWTRSSLGVAARAAPQHRRTKHHDHSDDASSHHDDASETGTATTSGSKSKQRGNRPPGGGRGRGEARGGQRNKRGGRGGERGKQETGKDRDSLAKEKGLEDDSAGETQGDSGRGARGGRGGRGGRARGGRNVEGRLTQPSSSKPKPHVTHIEIGSSKPSGSVKGP